MNKIEKSNSALENKNKPKPKSFKIIQNLRKEQGITLVALVITIVLNCCRSGRNHIKETNLKNILEKRINLL